MSRRPTPHDSAIFRFSFLKETARCFSRLYSYLYYRRSFITHLRIRQIFDNSRCEPKMWSESESVTRRITRKCQFRIESFRVTSSGSILMWRVRGRRGRGRQTGPTTIAHHSVHFIQVQVKDAIGIYALSRSNGRVDIELKSAPVADTPSHTHTETHT